MNQTVFLICGHYTRGRSPVFPGSAVPGAGNVIGAVLGVLSGLVFDLTMEETGIKNDVKSFVYEWLQCGELWVYLYQDQKQ